MESLWPVILRAVFLPSYNPRPKTNRRVPTLSNGRADAQTPDALRVVQVRALPALRVSLGHARLLAAGARRRPGAQGTCAEQGRPRADDLWPRMLGGLLHDLLRD